MATASTAPPIETDAVIIGAGPVGLFQAYQLGLLEIGAHIVDALPEVGGQCAQLYPDKPIYDIPALQVCSGHELAQRLLAQIQPFAVPLHLQQVVTTLTTQEDGRFALATSNGRRFVARCLFVAAGVGAFAPRPLKVDGIERFSGRQLHSHPVPREALAGQHVAVFGDDELALTQALTLTTEVPENPNGSGGPASVTLIHRRDAFTATPATIARLQAARAVGQVHFRAAQAIGFDAVGDTLTHLQLAGADGNTERVPVDTVLALLGLSPQLGPVSQWGLALSRKQVVVDPERFETNVPGIYAVGDINTYPGKRKLIVCGFHEATLAAYAAAQRLHPKGLPAQQQYTTTSPRLHQLLGLDKA